MATPKKPDRVEGIAPHKRGKWRIRYYKNGKRREEYRATEQAAKLRLAEIAKSLAGSGDDPSVVKKKARPAGSGLCGGDWLRLLWKLAKKIITDPADESSQRALKAIASAAMAAGRFVDDQEVRKEQEKIRGMIAEIMSSRKDGTRFTGRTAALAEDASATESLN
jgi:hypothetical protein